LNELKIYKSSRDLLFAYEYIEGDAVFYNFYENYKNNQISYCIDTAKFVIAQVLNTNTKRQNFLKI